MDTPDAAHAEVLVIRNGGVPRPAAPGGEGDRTRHHAGQGATVHPGRAGLTASQARSDDVAVPGRMLRSAADRCCRHPRISDHEKLQCPERVLKKGSVALNDVAPVAFGSHHRAGSLRTGLLASARGSSSLHFAFASARRSARILVASACCFVSRSTAAAAELHGGRERLRTRGLLATLPAWCQPTFECGPCGRQAMWMRLGEMDVLGRQLGVDEGAKVQSV